MKLVVEILIAIFLHPVAFILCLVNLAARRDLTGLEKFVWGVICVLWGIGPILYVLLGRGAMF
jgi:hypothetical protein